MVDVEDMYSMSSTPTMACSSGAATVSAIDLRIGARIVGGDDDRGRHHFGVLTDGQLDQGERTGDGDESRDDRGEDRAFDEEF